MTIWSIYTRAQNKDQKLVGHSLIKVNALSYHWLPIEVNLSYQIGICLAIHMLKWVIK